MIFFKVLMGINLKLCMVNSCTDRARRFLWSVKDTMYIKHLSRNQPAINYSEVLVFTAYKKKLENYEGEIADEMKLLFVCS